MRAPQHLGRDAGEHRLQVAAGDAGEDVARRRPDPLAVQGGHRGRTLPRVARRLAAHARQQAVRGRRARQVSPQHLCGAARQREARAEIEPRPRHRRDLPAQRPRGIAEQRLHPRLHAPGESRAGIQRVEAAGAGGAEVGRPEQLLRAALADCGGFHRAAREHEPRDLHAGLPPGEDDPIHLRRQVRLHGAQHAAGRRRQRPLAPARHGNPRLLARDAQFHRAETGAAQRLRRCAFGMCSRHHRPRRHRGRRRAFGLGRAVRVEPRRDAQHQVRPVQPAHARIQPAIRPGEARIHPARRLAAQIRRAGGIAAALVAQRVARELDLRPQPIQRPEGRPHLRQRILDPAEQRGIRAAEEPEGVDRAALVHAPRPHLEPLRDPAQRVAQVCPRPEPPPAHAERHVQRPEALRRGHVFARIEPRADEVLQPDRQRRLPVPFLQQPQLHVEGTVIRHAGARGRVQPLRQAIGRLQPGKGLKGEKPEPPLVPQRCPGLDHPIRPEPRIAHLQQADAAVIRPRPRHLLRGRSGGEEQRGDERCCRGGAAPAPPPGGVAPLEPRRNFQRRKGGGPKCPPPFRR